MTATTRPVVSCILCGGPANLLGPTAPARTVIPLPGGTTRVLVGGRAGRFVCRCGCRFETEIPAR